MSSSFILPIYCHSPLLEQTLHTVSKHTNLKLSVHVCFLSHIFLIEWFVPANTRNVLYRRKWFDLGCYRLIYTGMIFLWTVGLFIYVKLLNAKGWAHEICLLYLLGILIAQNASFRYNGESRKSSRAFSVATDPGSAPRVSERPTQDPDQDRKQLGSALLSGRLCYILGFLSTIYKQM